MFMSLHLLTNFVDFASNYNFDLKRKLKPETIRNKSVQISSTKATLIITNYKYFSVLYMTE